MMTKEIGDNFTIFYNNVLQTCRITGYEYVEHLDNETWIWFVVLHEDFKGLSFCAPEILIGDSNLSIKFNGEVWFANSRIIPLGRK